MRRTIRWKILTAVSGIFYTPALFLEMGVGVATGDRVACGSQFQGHLTGAWLTSRRTFARKHLKPPSNNGLKRTNPFHTPRRVPPHSFSSRKKLFLALMEKRRWLYPSLSGTGVGSSTLPSASLLNLGTFFLRRVMLIPPSSSWNQVGHGTWW